MTSLNSVLPGSHHNLDLVHNSNRNLIVTQYARYCTDNTPFFGASHPGFVDLTEDSLSRSLTASSFASASDSPLFSALLCSSPLPCSALCASYVL